MKFRRFFAIVLVVILLASCFAIFAACDDDSAKQSFSRNVNGAIYEENWTPTKDKAMILIPGLMASALYEASTDLEMWCPTGFIRLVKIYLERSKALTNKFKAGELSQDEYDKQYNLVLQNVLREYLSCDDNGKPLTTARVANMSSDYSADSFSGMGYIYEILYGYYHEQYDIVVWQYDWRQSNVESAKRLEEFINYCGYKKVQFYTHSMGGIVVSNWLKNAKNREKVELFMPFGAPMLGSMDAITNLFGENAFADIKPILEGMGQYFNLAEVARTIPSVVELLPNEEYFNSYQEGTSPITLDGKVVTYDEFLTALANQPWAKKENGEVKDCVKNLKSYNDDFYVNATYDSKKGYYVEDASSSEKVHVSKLVPTEYVAGVGVSTCQVASLITASDGRWTLSTTINNDNSFVFNAVDTIFEKYINGNEDGQISNSGYESIEGYKDGIFKGYGDATVPYISATCGLDVLKGDYDNVHLVFGIKHGPLMNDSCDIINGLAPAYLTGLAYVDEILPKYVDKTDAEIALSQGEGSGKSK